MSRKKKKPRRRPLRVVEGAVKTKPKRGVTPYRQAFAAARAFEQAEPWDSVSGDRPLMVRVPGEEGPLAVSVMGEGGEEFGIFVTRGAASVEELQGIMTTAARVGSEEEALRALDVLACTFERKRVLRQGGRRLLELSGLKGRGGGRVPMFSAKPRSGSLRDAERDEVALLGTLLAGVTRAVDEGLLDDAWEPDPLRPIELEIDGDLIGSSIEVRRIGGVDGAPWMDTDAEIDDALLAEAFTEILGADLDEPPPADGDDEGWRKVAGRAMIRATMAAKHELLRNPRTAGAYFGGAVLRDVLLVGPMRSHAEQAAQDYAFFDHRPGGRGRTLAELTLADPLPPADRRLLEAAAASAVSLYRVESVDPGRGVVLEDLLRGGAIEVADRGLSRSARPGLAFACRLFRAGGFVLCGPPGPALEPLQITPALAFLWGEGLDTTPAALRRGARLLGKLWWWVEVERRRGGQVALTNTDGEPLVPHRARLIADDEDAALAAIARRDDIDADEESGDLSWFRDDDNGPIPGGPLILGWIRRHGRQLVAETNSDARWRRMRGWLTRIPGLELDRVVREPMDVLDRGVLGAGGSPIDGLLEQLAGGRVDHGPEVAEVMERLMEEADARWIDTEVPVLGGHTPRETVRTARGRRRVQALIRSLPGGPGRASRVDSHERLLALLDLPPERGAIAPVPGIGGLTNSEWVSK